MNLVASGGIDPTIKVWDISTGDVIATLNCRFRSMHCLCFSPCGKFLVVSYDNNTIGVWDCQSWKMISTIASDSSFYAVHVTYSRDSCRILVVFLDGSIQVLSCISEEVIEFAHRTEHTATFSLNGEDIAVSSRGTIEIRDINTGELKQMLMGHKLQVESIEYSQDDSLIVSGSYDYTAIIWSTASGTAVHVLRGHTGIIYQVKFNHNATLVVSCSFDQTARIWDVATGECLMTLRGHTERIQTCCFSEDGSKIVTGSYDKTVKVWDSYTGEELRTFRGHSYFVRSLAYRPCEMGSYI